MNREFVPQGLSMRLKKLGFDEPCLAVFELIVVGDTIPRFRYNWDGEDRWFNHNKAKDEYDDHDWYWSAPTFSQAFRWFRDRHDIVSWVSKDEYGFSYDLFNKSYTQMIQDSYEEAELACLEKLLEIVEQQSKL